MTSGRHGGRGTTALGPRRRARIAALLAVIGLVAVVAGVGIGGPAPVGPPPPAAAAPVFAIPAEDAILATLTPGHPRLQLTPTAVTDLKARLAADPTLAALYVPVRQRAHDLLALPPVIYEKPDGVRLLEVSREALRRLQTLGLVWLVDGEPEIAARGAAELAAIEGFPDWNPAHFLDTAEMTHAAAIGLDWLWAALTPAERGAATAAIRDKGLIPARDAYDGTAPLLSRFWTTVGDNWNPVCNGGIALGALAIADAEPALAAHDLHEGLTRLPKALAHDAPDGGWPEGVSYWLYATDYTVYLLSGLGTALGTDFGLSGAPGFDQTGDVPIHMSGPSGERWNWADDGEPRPAPAASSELWLADRFGRPAWREYQLAHADPDAMDVVWYRPATGAPEVVPLDRAFTGVDVATMRGSWNDAAATWVGFKGGLPWFSHGQLDSGSFVVDADGQRWAMDLGRDDYGLPGYFDNLLGGDRWTYYRNRAEGHNTLVIDPGLGADQTVNKESKIVRTGSGADDAFAIVDLAPNYGNRPVERGVRLLERRRVLVQDELALPTAGDVWWFLHTRADVVVAPDGRSATFTQAGHALRARLLSPADATFSVMDAAPLPSSPDPVGQTPNAAVRKLAIHLPGTTTQTIAVVLEPDPVDPPAPVELEPLAQWAIAPPTTTTTTTTSSTTTSISTTTTTATTSTTTTASSSTTTTAPEGGGTGDLTGGTTTTTGAGDPSATSPPTSAVAAPAAAVLVRPVLTG